jgi:hypothetical protein
MIENVTSLLGGVVLLLGIGLIALTWARSKYASVAKQIDSVTNRVSNAIGAGASTRTDALRDADQLFQYFEDSRNSEGQEAVKQVVSELFSRGNKS